MATFVRVVVYNDYKLPTQTTEPRAVVSASVPASVRRELDAVESLGMCDEAHVIPAGVYLEE